MDFVKAFLKKLMEESVDYKFGRGVFTDSAAFLRQFEIFTGG